MNIYISHSSNYDYENELYRPLKESKLSKLHKIFLPHEPDNIDADAIDVLKHIDVLVAEVSLPATGQGIELGQASVMGVPIICFYRVGAKTSSSLRFVTSQIIEYNDTSDLLGKLDTALGKM